MHPALHSIYAHLEHWKKALMGPVVTIVLLIYQQATGRSPTWGWFLALIFAGLFWQYKSELDRERKQPRVVPLLSLGYDRYIGGSDDRYSGFYLRTEGDFRVSNVRVSSPETVGHSHTRLFLRWVDPTHEIGKERVPIDVTCMSWAKGKDAAYPFGGIGRYQIDSFFKAKSKEPNEFIVTVSYTDMSGHTCPSRQFLVKQIFESVLKDKWEISCQPVKV
jgi:hypothetical protein